MCVLGGGEEGRRLGWCVTVVEPYMGIWKDVNTIRRLESASDVGCIKLNYPCAYRFTSCQHGEKITSLPQSLHSINLAILLPVCILNWRKGSF